MASFVRRSGFVVDDYFDWEGDRHLRRPLSETIIYETHVRGFTNSKNFGRRATRNVLGADRKDPLLARPGSDGGRADAGSRVSDT